jgi:hypothetical protein
MMKMWSIDREIGDAVVPGTGTARALDVAPVEAMLLAKAPWLPWLSQAARRTGKAIASEAYARCTCGSGSKARREGRRVTCGIRAVERAMEILLDDRSPPASRHRHERHHRWWLRRLTTCAAVRHHDSVV